MKIPPENRDLCRFVRKRDIIRSVCCATWIAVWIAGAVVYNLNHKTYPDYRRIIGWKMAVLIAIAAVSGFLLFRLWTYFTDRTCVGTIQRSGLSHSYTASPDPGANATDYDFRLNTALRIRTANGKRRRIRFEQKEGFYLYYHEGIKVIHFHGLPYPVALESDAKTGYVCAACGRITKEKRKTCEVCGFSIIDPTTLDPSIFESMK